MGRVSGEVAGPGRSPEWGLRATPQRAIPTVGLSLQCRADRSTSSNPLTRFCKNGSSATTGGTDQPYTFPPKHFKPVLGRGGLGHSRFFYKTQMGGARKERRSHDVPFYFPSPKISTGRVYC